MRHLFVIYVILALVFVVGWLPEKKRLAPAISHVVTMEFGSFVEGQVQETSIAVRKANEQREERLRRKIEKQHLREKRLREKRLRLKKMRETYRLVLDKNSRNILERIVEAEAGDQDTKGRQLVANVIINRVKSKKFPDTIKGVVFSPRQFSPVSNGRYYSVTISKKTKQAVEQALREKDNSQGALYFMCRSASSPANIAWFDRDLTRLLSYGCHEFFR